MSTATVTSKGQITIPVEIRTKLDLQTGDRVDFVIDESGRVSFCRSQKYRVAQGHYCKAR